MSGFSSKNHGAGCPCHSCPQFEKGRPDCGSCRVDVTGNSWCLACSQARKGCCDPGWKYRKKIRAGRRPIKQRIMAAFGANLTVKYHDLLDAVFPVDLYPKARNRSSNGGPPGCCMVLGRALRELGIRDNGRLGYQRELTMPPYLVAEARKGK